LGGIFAKPAAEPSRRAHAHRPLELQDFFIARANISEAVRAPDCGEIDFPALIRLYGNHVFSVHPPALLRLGSLS
jgi:hypothetical protein